MAAAALAVTLRALALLCFVEIAGVRSIGHRLDLGWVAVVAITELATFPAYGLSYRSVTRLGDHVRLPVRTVMGIVIAGFGPLSVSGGFQVDRVALERLEVAEDAATAGRYVGAMATLEWAVLAPAAWGVAIALLISGSDVSGTLTWPWAIGVPLGLEGAACLLQATRAHALAHPFGHQIAFLDRLVTTLDAVKSILGQPVTYSGAWTGMTLYWAAEICALSASLRAVGLRLGLDESVLAYATGYVASRRSLPLGGAGLAEALLLCSLNQLRQPVGPSLEAILIYRMFNFMIGVIPSLVAYRSLRAVDR